MWVVVFQKRQPHHDVRHPFTARGVGDLLHVLNQTRNIKKFRYWSHFFVFLVDHHGRADATIRVTTARHLAPLRLWSMDEVGEISKRTHQRKWEPIARRLGNANLVLHVVSEV